MIPEWMDELRPHIFPFNDSYLASQYLSLATDDDILLFLEAEPLWDTNTGEWTLVANASCLEDLQENVMHVLAAIISKLGQRCQSSEATREVCITGSHGLLHMERHHTNGRTRPSIVIRATGPSFQEPSDDACALGYTNAASCVNIVQDRGGDMDEEDDIWHTEQSSVYARQIFIQQPNRRFVRNLVVSEKWCQLFHFDRSGAQYTSHLDIHKDVKIFVRLVLGLSCFDEKILGFDASVQWTHSSGRKTAGTISVADPEGVSRVFTLSDVDPVFRRYDLYGRGSTGWLARDSNGSDVFIKDSWRDGAPEYTVLQHTLGVEGAAQMVCFEAAEETTAELRANGNGGDVEGFTNKTSTRIVLQRYGQNILSFTSQSQLLGAIRDAIAAHRVLVNDREVLHRDISQGNILLADDGAPVGRRGVLVDFDLASQGPRKLGQTASDSKAGTMLFMSCAMLRAFDPLVSCVPNHDQLDDLESFYYILHDLMFSWSRPGLRSDNRPSYLDRWDHDTMSRRADAKQVHYLSPLPTHLLSSFWLPATVELLRSLMTLSFSLVREKYVASNLTSSVGVEKYKALLAQADDYYDQFLALFDKALDELKTQESEGWIREPPKALPLDSSSCADLANIHASTACGAPGPAATVAPPAPAPIAIPTRVLRERKPKAMPTPQPATTKKRSRPQDFNGVAPSTKRSRGEKAGAATRVPAQRKGWVRTTPHRTRAWVKAHPEL